MNICPKCKVVYKQPPALSRVDNKTAICPLCGSLEAITHFTEPMRTKEKEKIIKLYKELEQ